MGNLRRELALRLRHRPLRGEAGNLTTTQPYVVIRHQHLDLGPPVPLAQGEKRLAELEVMLAELLLDLT